LLLYESSESDAIVADFFFFSKFLEVPTIYNSLTHSLIFNSKKYHHSNQESETDNSNLERSTRANFENQKFKYWAEQLIENPQ